MWLFPVAVLLSLALRAWSTHPRAVFVLVAAPAFFLCSYIADAPRRGGLVTPLQGFFWAALVPFLIWATMLGVLFAVVFAAGGFSSGTPR